MGGRGGDAVHTARVLVERERVGFEVGYVKRLEGFNTAFIGPVEKFGEDALGVASAVAGLVGFGFGEE